MDIETAIYREKPEQELSAMIQTYLAGNAPDLRDDVFAICQILASRQSPPADPAEIYRQHLAAYFPDAVKSDF